MMKKYTEQELVEYDGKNGRSVYLAYEGKVYDVSSSFLWSDGTHQVLHDAGVDLTEAMSKAPHGSEFLKSFRLLKCFASCTGL